MIPSHMLPVPIGKHGLSACVHGQFVAVAASKDSSIVMTYTAALELRDWISRQIDPGPAKPTPAMEADVVRAEKTFDVPGRAAADVAQCRIFEGLATLEQEQAKARKDEAEAWAKKASQRLQPTGTI